MIAAANEHALLGLALVVVLGGTAQWLAWWLRLPSILLLLAFGILAGPVLGWVKPDELLGPMLMPVISVGVAIVLFEGGLSLKLGELRRVGRAVAMLCTAAVPIAWVLGAVAARYTLGFDWGLALLLGAILVVTGPTVIIPLLRQVRPTREVASALKWEGIVNDPTGAILAVLVVEALIAGLEDQAPAYVVRQLGLAAVVGVSVGLAGAGALVLAIRRHWIPDAIEAGVVMAVVVGIFALANHVVPESGLLAVTVMGVAMANQPWARIEELARFKASLGTLVVALLFILLAARLQGTDFDGLDWRVAVFAGLMILVVRPATVLASTQWTALTWRQRCFIAFMAPRGIVAAAVASVFALRLADAGLESAKTLAPVVFVMILTTIAVYGLGASPLARRLGVSRKGVGTVLIGGANQVGRAIGQGLKERGFDVRLIDTDRRHVHSASMSGLNARYTNIFSQHAEEWLESTEVGLFLGMYPDDEVNSLAAQRYTHDLGRKNVYQLLLSQPGSTQTEVSHVQGRVLFGAGITHDALSAKLRDGWGVKVTPLTETFGLERYREQYPGALELFVIDKEATQIRPITRIAPVTPQPGQILISLVAPEDAEAKNRQSPDDEHSRSVANG